MRLAILQDHLRNGGTERQSLAIANGLAARGLEVHLIIFRRGGILDAKAAKSSFSLHFLSQGPLKTDWFAPRLFKTLKQLRIDFALPMGRMANCYAGLFANRPRPFALLATIRTGRDIPLLYRKALRQTDFLVANSQEALKRMNSKYGIHRPDTSCVIYNGCSIEATAPKAATDSKAVKFCTVSMFRPQKRQIRLIRICSKLPTDLNWTLTLAGDGPCLAECEEEAQRLGLAERVRFVGLLEDPTSLYRNSDVALHASDLESLPNFLVEAQMAGLPVIAYDVNGVAETFLDAQSGFLIPHKDEAKFLQALEKLSLAPNLRRQMSDAARHYAASRFSQKSQIDAYFELLHSSKLTKLISR